MTATIKNALPGYNAWNMVLDKGGLGIADTRSGHRTPCSWLIRAT
jgi:hypothetical protein